MEQAPARLPATTRIGTAHLAVHDLERSLAYYTGQLGFRTLESSGDHAVLGSDRPLLRLTEERDAKPRPRGVSGLYHVAYLLPTRAHLARFVRRIAEQRTPVQGASDHLVSEAIYLGDPDGHGIEVYADRPREGWLRKDGTLHMATLPLDVGDLLASDAEPKPYERMPDGGLIGHIHLNVGDVAKADAFYQDLGFDRMATIPSASFLSAGGYHHHIAVNAWEGAGAPPAPPGTLGLREFTLQVPKGEAQEALRKRLADASRDPGGNALRIVEA